MDAALIDDLRRAHGVHTLILYGSRARGDATTESDIDVAGFAEVAETLRDARLWNGMFLDAFVYPTAVAQTPDADMLKLCGGRVLLDERGIALPLLEHLAALERRGPPDYFALRGEWYRGPKQALASLQLHDPATFAAFERALAPEGSLDALDPLVDRVVDGSREDNPFSEPPRSGKEWISG